MSYLMNLYTSQLQNGQQEKQGHLFEPTFAAAFGDPSELDSFGVCGHEDGRGDSGVPSCFAFSRFPPLNDMLFPASPVNLKIST